MSDVYEDQGLRLAQFKTDHPEVDVMSPLDTHSPYWKAIRNGQIVDVQYRLGVLLDRLGASA